MNLDLDIKDVPDQDLETNVYPAIEKGEDFLNKSIGCRTKKSAILLETLFFWLV